LIHQFCVLLIVCLFLVVFFSREIAD